MLLIEYIMLFIAFMFTIGVIGISLYIIYEL